MDTTGKILRWAFRRIREHLCTRKMDTWCRHCHHWLRLRDRPRPRRRRNRRTKLMARQCRCCSSTMGNGMEVWKILPIRWDGPQRKGTRSRALHLDFDSILNRGKEIFPVIRCSILIPRGDEIGVKQWEDVIRWFSRLNPVRPTPCLSATLTVSVKPLREGK